jgi:hypothetical protein
VQAPLVAADDDQRPGAPLPLRRDAVAEPERQHRAHALGALGVAVLLVPVGGDEARLVAVQLDRAIPHDGPPVLI